MITNDPNEPTETAIVDLMADLKHLVRILVNPKEDPNGHLKWQELSDSSHRHFIAEGYGE